MVFIRKDIKSLVTNIEKYAENTGFLHVFPNKGGICMSLKVRGTTLAFVSCHLTAHEGADKCYMRNESVKEILGGIRVGKSQYDIVNTSHHVIWMGDMNYRITFDTETPGDIVNIPKNLDEDNDKVKQIISDLEDEDEDEVHEAGEDR
jgi:hypothetical protein